MAQKTIMLPESLQNFEGEVESGLLGIALLEHLDDAQALGVVIKTAVIPHQPVEGFLPGVPEGSVAEVMGQSDRLRQILIEGQGTRDGATDRGNLDGVGEPGPVVVARAAEEDLSLSIQSAEGSTMDDAIAVALITGSEDMFLLRTAAARRLGGALGIGSEEGFAGIRRHGRK
jgi:hypothetical protein